MKNENRPTSGRNAPSRPTVNRMPRTTTPRPLPSPRIGGAAGRIPRGQTEPVAPSRARRTDGPTPSRRVALDVLVSVDRDGAYVQLALDKRLSAEKLIDADRRLATELVYGTLENRIRLDWALSQFMERPMDDPIVLNAMRMGAYQILFLDRVPDSAAVADAVNLVRAGNRNELTGLTNAVLRNLSRARASIEWPGAETPAPQRFSILYSVPEWLVETLIRQYGEAEAEALLAYRPDDHITTVRPNLLRMDPESYADYLTKAGIQFERGLVPYAFRIRGAAPGTDFIKGIHSIQGEGSMLSVLALGVKNGWQVLDACAAPGGKTLFMSELMHGTGRIYAWDTHPHRVELISAAVHRLGLDNVRPRIQDATYFRDDMVASMDAVLVDAPCSGFGVMLQKPDLKYKHTPESIDSLAKLQAKLLDTCSRYVKPGGVLVYSTCTVLEEENQAVVKAFLDTHPEYSCRGLESRMPDAIKPYITPLGLQILPNRDGIEGFFIARLERAKETNR